MIKKTLVILLLSCGSALAQHSAALSWNAAPAKPGVIITVYNLYRSDTPGGQVSGTHPLDPTGIIGTNFTDNTVVGGQTYYYKVAAYCPTCTTKEGPMSPEYQAVIPGDTVPGTPTITTVVIH